MSIMEPPYTDATTQDIKTALAGLSENARRLSRTGPKTQENAAHQVMNDLLTELKRRKALGLA